MSARQKRTPERTRKGELATEHRLRCGYRLVMYPDRCDFYDPDGNLLTQITVYPEKPWWHAYLDCA